MDKATLLKYLSGELDQKQIQEVLDWVNRSHDNEQYFITIMNLWVTQTLSNDQASEQEYQHMLAAIKQQKNRGVQLPIDVDKSFKNSLFKRLFWGAAVVVLFLTASNIFLLLDKKEHVGSPKNSIATVMPPKNFNSYKELYTNKGVKAMVLLPDSSVVYLNSDTKIVYPDQFDSLSRYVKIEGEAYFKVAKDSTRPMIVATSKGFSVRVLGTEFNLKANNNDADAQATLYNGKIDILRERAGKVVITTVQPHETITIGENDFCTKTVFNEPQKLCAWKDGKLIFENTSVSEAVKMLERWHGVHFVVADKSILDFKLTATFEQESIVQILELLKIISYLDYSIDGKCVTLRRR